MKYKLYIAPIFKCSAPEISVYIPKTTMRPTWKNMLYNPQKI